MRSDRGNSGNEHGISQVVPTIMITATSSWHEGQTLFYGWTDRPRGDDSAGRCCSIVCAAMGGSPPGCPRDRALCCAATINTFVHVTPSLRTLFTYPNPPCSFPSRSKPKSKVYNRVRYMVY